jgi:hypothetical protein
MNNKEFTANELMAYLKQIPEEIRDCVKISIMLKDVRQVQIKEQLNVEECSNELSIYLNYIYENAIEGVSPGYNKISRNTGLTIETCRKIKGYLEQQGVVKTDGRQTFILNNNWAS